MGVIRPDLAIRASTAVEHRSLKVLVGVCLGRGVLERFGLSE